MGRRSAKVYPLRLCVAIMRSIAQQAREDGVMNQDGKISQVCPDESDNHGREQCDGATFYDDCKGKHLSSEGIRQARERRRCANS